ncbi:hypothetical protein [Adlercreutzia caecimuris]|uniref:hypothetical protein n=1 Tax=Adlercreutzia caecimuris TaxID=671266 RepID=UPI00258CBB93|nr:hypothetical protein [Adlercreutzia caecimuris]
MNSEKRRTGIDRRSFLIAAGITCLGIFAHPASAFAAIIKWGTPLKKTVDGVTYTYKSGFSAGSDPCVYTQITASKTVSAGTMQARAIAVKETNLAIAAASNWMRNSKGTSLTVKKQTPAVTLGCTSRGRVQIKNVQGQLSCNPIRTRSLAPELSVNEHGQTLGTYEDVERGAVPDLVGIVADSGIDGYAYWEQFDAEDASDAIPVYAEDGTTQVGIFTFGDK